MFDIPVHQNNIKKSLASLYILTKDMYDDYRESLDVTHPDVVSAKAEMESLANTYRELFNSEPPIR